MCLVDQAAGGLRKQPVLPLLIVLVALVSAGRSTAAISGDIPQVIPGFPHQLACTPGQLLHRQVGLGRITNVVYHNGLIHTNNVAGASPRWWRFNNPSDPTSLVIYNNSPAAMPTDQGTHAHTKTGDWICGTWGCRLRRESAGVNVAELRPPELPGEVGGGYTPQNQPNPDGGTLHRLYYPWAIPFNWAQYGATDGSARLWRATELLAEWQPLSDHGVVGSSILLGNLLFLISDASMLGVAVYDIGPVFETPAQLPTLLDKFTGPVGAYIGAVWENYLVLSGGVDRDILFVLDFSDPGDLRLVATMDLRGTASMNAGTSVPYVQTQDEFVFTRRHKINMEMLVPVLELDEVGNQRPAGSVAGPLDVSQYTLPLGNLLVSGGYSAANRDGIGVWCHQAAADTRAPYVGYHIPRPGQTQYPLGAPISLVIAETLESFTIVNGETVLVRPVGGQAIDAWTSFAHDGVLTITPREYLDADTTYEVVVVAGGIKDAAGNGIEGYSFTFSTGGNVGGGNGAPQIGSLIPNPAPAAPGQSVQFVVSASDPEGDPLQYRFSFGDGEPATQWSSSAQISRSFATAGHYEIKAQVRDVKPDGTHSVVTHTLTLTVAAIPAGPLPTQSSQLALDPTRRRLWVVDPDNDLLTRVHADTQQVEQQIHLGNLVGIEGPLAPVGVAVAGNGDVWIALRDADRVVVLSTTGALLANVTTGFGSAPQAVAISRDGGRAFVSLYGRGESDPGNGQLLRFDTATRSETGRRELGPSARAIAISGDGTRVFVARFVSTEHYGEVWEVNGNTMALVRTLPLWRDRGLGGMDSGGSDGPGVPNYVSSLVLSPQQDWLWYTAIKADTNRGDFFRQNGPYNLPMMPDSTVRSVLGRFDLMHSSGQPREPGREGTGNARARVDIDNTDSPSALVFSPRGDYVFVALQGNDNVAVFDDLAIRQGGGRSSVWRMRSGAAPQATLWDPASDTLWVRNLIDRSVSAYALADFLAVGDRSAKPNHIPTSSHELLPADVLAGKRIFYFAGNAPDGQNEMSLEGYISCASCHVDGGHDGRTWDFTQRGEGFRNSTDLRGRAGMVQGNVHWSANFDEIQDFVLDIVGEFGGRGFLPPGQVPNPPLGAANAGRAIELDQLADYVTSLDLSTLPRSPYRLADGRRSQQALAGAEVFVSSGCVLCHVPERGFTDSTLGTATLHDVGTLRTSSGSRLGGPLTGIDTPTLLGLWDTAPYFHDGSAPTLEDVVVVAGGRMYEAESATLAAGAQLPGFPEFNEDSSFHGHMVTLASNGAHVIFEGVDGGAGGTGAIELRYLPRSTSVVRLTVNGSHVQERSVPQQQTHFEWRRIRFEDVPLNPGSSNQVEVRRVSAQSTSQHPGLDNITVSTAGELSRAAAHRSASTLAPASLEALLAYLRSLDGRDDLGNLSVNDLLFADGFE